MAARLQALAGAGEVDLRRIDSQTVGMSTCSSVIQTSDSPWFTPDGEQGRGLLKADIVHPSPESLAARLQFGMASGLDQVPIGEAIDLGDQSRVSRITRLTGHVAEAKIEQSELADGSNQIGSRAKWLVVASG